MERMSTDPTKYVVFDVETNGLSAKEHDLLSISFYKPDDGKEYSKFLPLELNQHILTTSINGITKSDLDGATALTQNEFDDIVKQFELKDRTILIYAGGDFDNRFLSIYMERHRISGFDKLTFYNIKERIISSKYSDGNITKDNFCTLFNIGGVKNVHSGLNDCKLEWELFKRMEGYYYLVTNGDDIDKDNVFRLNDDYIIPVSLLSSHPKLGKLLYKRPYIECKSHVIRKFEIDATKIQKFPNNINGMLIEHLINSMLNVSEQNTRSFLIENKSKLEFVGKIPKNTESAPMIFNHDGTFTALRKEDKKLEKEMNATAKNLKKQIQPMTKFIKNEIFNGEQILSQELVIDYENKILALCDLSSSKAILEIKTDYADSLVYKEQLFYEANGRDCYHLKMDWITNSRTNLLEKLIFEFVFVDVRIGNPSSKYWVLGKRESKKLERIEEIEDYLSGLSITLINFKNISSPVKLKCEDCGNEWAIGYKTLMNKKPICPKCKSSGRAKVEMQKNSSPLN